MRRRGRGPPVRAGQPQDRRSPAGDDRDLEGCLSIPGYAAYVTRRERVWVVAQDRRGRRIRVAGSGLLGRAFQHELDHLDGKLYIDYLDSMDELISVGGATRTTTRPARTATRSTTARPPAFERPPWHDRRSGPPAGGRAGPNDLLRLRGVRRPDPRRACALPATRIVAVVTAPDRPAGRSRAVTRHAGRGASRGARAAASCSRHACGLPRRSPRSPRSDRTSACSPTTGRSSRRRSSTFPCTAS